MQIQSVLDKCCKELTHAEIARQCLQIADGVGFNVDKKYPVLGAGRCSTVATVTSSDTLGCSTKKNAPGSGRTTDGSTAPRRRWPRV